MLIDIGVTQLGMKGVTPKIMKHDGFDSRIDGKWYKT